jgi:hypothetical protein
MPKYNVIVTRDLTESTLIEVEAVNADAAELVAFETVINARWNLPQMGDRRGMGPQRANVSLDE